MKSWLKWLLPVLVVVLIGGLVGRALQARKVEQAAASTVRTNPALDLLPADVLTARRVELTRTLEVSGGLKAVNSALVKAKVAAELKSLSVREGDTVKRGQVIGQLDTLELALRVQQAEQSAASARAQADITRRTLENNRALVAQGFISPTGLEASVSNDAASQANLQAANAAVALARKALGDARLVAPISGLVSQRLLQPGERAAVDARIVEIVDLSKLELEAAVAPEDVSALGVGSTAQLQVDGIDKPVSARVARINPSAQVGSRSVMVYLAVDPQPALRQGLFAKGRIATATGTALAVPLTAVRTDQARPYVLQIVDNRASVRTVELGQRGEVEGQPWVEIVSGLPEGAQLLAGITGLVRDGTPLRVLPTGAPASPAGTQPLPAATPSGSPAGSGAAALAAPTR